MIRNPLIRRFQCSQLRPRQAWIYLTIYFVITAIIVISNVGYYRLPDSKMTLDMLYQNLYVQFLVIQVLIMWVWMPCNTWSAISAEILRKTYDFFQMLPLSAQQKTLGLAIGRNLVPLLLAAINIVLLCVSGYPAGKSLNLQAQSLLILVSVAVLLNLGALVLSGRSTRSGQRSSHILVFILLGFFIAPHLLGLCFGAQQQANLEYRMASFFALQIPILVLVSLISLYFGMWAFLGMLRQFNCEGETLFSPAGACLFVEGFAVLVMGLFWPLTMHINIGEQWHQGSFWVVSFIPLLFVPLGAAKGYNDYLERLGLVAAGPGRSRWYLMGRISNVTLTLALFAIWAGFAFSHGLLVGFSLAVTLHIIAVHFSFYLLLVLVFELYTVYQPVNNKIQFLVGFLILLDLFLPLLLGAVFESSKLIRFSLFGLWADIFPSEIIRNMSLHYTPLIFNLLFCLPALWLVIRRYRAAITAWNGDALSASRT